MNTNYIPEKLKEFENWVVKTFNDGKLKSPVHLSGSINNELEEFLIETFKQIKPNDWVFSTYRSHYHALLKGITEEWLKKWILDNKSIHVMNSEHKFFTSAIVGGTLSIALGTALGLKMKQDKKDRIINLFNSGIDDISKVEGFEDFKDKKMKSQQTKEDEIEGTNVIHLETRSSPVEANKTVLKTRSVDNQSVDVYNNEKVWVFVGDMTCSSGQFHEAFKFAINHKLPIKFICECNFLSTNTDTANVWGITREQLVEGFKNWKEKYPSYFDVIFYERLHEHYGTGKFVASLWKNIDKNDVRSKGF